MAESAIDTGDAAVNGSYGITTELQGYTVETENIRESTLAEPVPNQHNQVENELDYDTRYELTLTIRGKVHPRDTTSGCCKDGFITYDGKKYKVDTVENAGTYNGLRRYSITAHRTTKFPKQS